MTTRPTGTVLQAGRQQAGLTVSQLWMACWGLGSTATEQELADFLAGARDPSATEYDLVAQALNERFVELGDDHPVPYADEL